MLTYQRLALCGLVAWLWLSRCFGDVGAWTCQAAHTSSASRELQYILGWPVPHPAFGAEHEMRSGEAEYGRLFDAWVRHIVIAVKTERSVAYFPACAWHVVGVGRRGGVRCWRRVWC